MNPITLPIAELKPALMGLTKVVAKRASLPVLSTIRIDRDNSGRILLSATDLDTFVTAQITGTESGHPSSVLVPFTALNNIAKACQGNDALHVSSDNPRHVSIRYPIGSQTAAQRIETLPVEEWPPIPKVESNPIPLPTSMRSALLEAMQCASTDTTRYVLQGACIDVSDSACHNVIGTDGKHLYSSNSFHIPLTESVIIPESKFLEWRGFAEDGDWSLQVWGDKESPWLRLESDHWSFITRPVDGKYPNWRQVIPDKEAAKSRVLFPEDCAPVLQAILKLPDCDQTNHKIGLRLDRHRLTLLGRNPGNEDETEIQIENAESKGDPVTIYLNRQYLAKALKFGLRELHINDALSAMRFVAGGRQMVVMPVRTGSEEPVNQAVPATSPEAPTPQPEAEQSTPEAVTTAASQTSTERKTMQTTNDSHIQPAHEAGPIASERPALETAIAQVEILRGDFRNAIVGLTKLSEALKLAQREQKTGEREVQLVRAALGKLQAVRF